MTDYVIAVFRDGTQISQSFCNDSTVTEIVVDDAAAPGSHTYTLKVGVYPQDSVGFVGTVGFARMTATVHKR